MPASEPKRLGPLALALAYIAIVPAIVPAFASGATSELVRPGIFFGQVFALSFWAAYGPGKPIARVLAAAAVVLLMSNAAWWVTGDVSAFGYYTTACFLTSMFLMSLGDWKPLIVPVDELGAEPDSIVVRLKIMHVIVIMTLTSALIAGCRYVDAAFLMFFASFLAVLLTAAPLFCAVRATLTREPTLRRSVIETALAVLLSTAPLAIALSTGEPLPAIVTSWSALIVASLAATVVVSLSALVLRLSGYRITSMRSLLWT